MFMARIVTVFMVSILTVFPNFCVANHKKINSHGTSVRTNQYMIHVKRTSGLESAALFSSWFYDNETCLTDAGGPSGLS